MPRGGDRGRLVAPCALSAPCFARLQPTYTRPAGLSRVRHPLPAAPQPSRRGRLRWPSVVRVPEQCNEDKFGISRGDKFLGARLSAPLHRPQGEPVGSRHSPPLRGRCLRSRQRGVNLRSLTLWPYPLCPCRRLRASHGSRPSFGPRRKGGECSRDAPPCRTPTHRKLKALLHPHGERVEPRGWDKQRSVAFHLALRRAQDEVEGGRSG